MLGSNVMPTISPINVSFCKWIFHFHFKIFVRSATNNQNGGLQSIPTNFSVPLDLIWTLHWRFCRISFPEELLCWQQLFIPLMDCMCSYISHRTFILATTFHPIHGSNLAASTFHDWRITVLPGDWMNTIRRHIITTYWSFNSTFHN